MAFRKERTSRSLMASIITFMIAFWAGAVALSVSAGGAEQTNPKANVLSIGGSVTEIVYALDQQHRLVARDTTSVFPADVFRLQDVGYMRALSAEGVLSVEPELIISEDGAGPPETISLLQEASIPFIIIPDEYSSAGVVNKILAVGRALEVEDKAQILADQVATQLAKAEKKGQENSAQPKRVMFILSTKGARVMVSGTNTAANAIIGLAGAVNAVSEFEGYKLITDEAIAAAAPDVILMMERRGDHSSSDEELFALPSLSITPAAKTASVIRMNGLFLLGFGPRTAQAIVDLNEALYGS